MPEALGSPLIAIDHDANLHTRKPGKVELMHCSSTECISRMSCNACLVQIVNSTMLSLNVGEQSSVKKAVIILATIAPGEAYSMPALRKEPGLICFRPAGRLSHPFLCHVRRGTTGDSTQSGFCAMSD